MTYDLGQKNPKLAQDIEDYFVKIPPGKMFPEGLENGFCAGICKRPRF
jgi:hypothetical protein